MGKIKFLILPNILSILFSTVFLFSNAFAQDSASFKLPFEFAGNHIYLPVKINDSETVWMMFDTGASQTFIDVDKAKELKLQISDGAIKNTTLKFQTFKVENQDLQLTRLGFGSNDGHSIDGLLGYDFIKRFVVEIDYQKRIITFHSPANFKRSKIFTEVPLTMLEDDSGGKVPLASVKIGDKIEGKLIVDTGVRSVATFNMPFVNNNNLLKLVPKTIDQIVGGGATVRVAQFLHGRLPKMEFGGFLIKDSVVGFSQATDGVTSISDFGGIIGGGILRRFKVIFDYSKEKLYLEPNKDFSSAYKYDATGTYVISEGNDYKTFRVRQVISPSPGSDADLRENDIILMINKKATSNLTLDKLRELFKQENKIFKLKIKRKEGIFELRMKTRKLL